jgi:signal transduction histidine kinase
METTPRAVIIYAIEIAVVGIVYGAAAYWSLSLSSVHTFAAPLWPPTGIALAALFFRGFRIWPAVAIGAFAINVWFGAPILAALGVAIGNTMEAVVGVYLLRSFRFNPLFERISDSAILIIVALVVPIVSAVIGPVALALTGVLSPANLPLTSTTWWAGDSLGALVVAPFLIRWFARPFFSTPRSRAHWTEAVLFFFAVSIVAMLIFLDPIPHLDGVLSPYLIFVPLTWGSLRVGARFMTAGIFIVAAIAAEGTLIGLGPFSGTPADDPLLLLQMFVAIIAMISLLFVAAVEERKRATQELQRSVRTLREDVEEISEADHAKNEFIAILSHELRNPLAPVLSSLELLRLRAHDRGDTSEIVRSMERQIRRITRLLDDLLDITRISRKKFSLQVERVRLQDVLTHSITTVEDTIQKQQHALTLSLPNDPIWIDADPLRLEQVFVNLLHNAAKYTAPGGTIDCSAATAFRGALLGVNVCVRDNGRGIPRDELKRIFEPFRQLGAHDQEHGGLGIGLSLAKRFVELHGGEIAVTSAGIGAGSTFVVWLPLAKNMLLPAASAEDSKRSAPTQAPNEPHIVSGKVQRSVLVVDDNSAAAHAIAQLLSHSGHDVRTAENGAEALSVLAQFRPEIIFLDVGLPGESGYDVARTIRNYLDPQPVLVALTGFGQEDDKRRAYDAGFDYHLTKPVSIAELEKILST